MAAGLATLALPRRAPAATRTLEVVHWWAGGSEAAAIRTLREKIEAAGYGWADTAVDGPDVAKTAALTRVLGGSPPGVMLWFIGRDLPDLYAEGVIRDVDSVAVAEGWDAVLPDAVARRLKVGGKYVAVPIDTHCGNWLFANLRVLQRAGVEPPSTWPDMLAACARVAQAGAVPLAFGGQPWQEGSVFLTVLAGVGGTELLRRFSAEQDVRPADEPALTAAFETFGALRRHVDKGSPNRSWLDSAALVSSGQAAFFISGDWARGALNRAGLRPEADYTCRPAPGTDGLFLATVDAFCMPRSDDAGLRAAQDDFARIAMGAAAQRDFNMIKGSIPARTDVDLAAYDGYARAAAELRRTGTLVPSVSMGMTTATRQAYYDVVHRFWSTPDADPAAAARQLRTTLDRNRT